MFAAGGAWMVQFGNAFGWLVFGFSSLGILVGVWQVVFPDRLVVEAEQIAVTRFSRPEQYRLDHCGEFRVWKSPVGRQQLVVFDYEGKGETRGGRANRWLADATSALPDTYGFTAVELAALNDARDVARRRSSSA